MFASDRATGDGAEHHDEAAAAMDTDIEGVGTSENSSGGSNKRFKRSSSRCSELFCRVVQGVCEQSARATETKFTRDLQGSL
uniref:Uncharacterized protein n=1 Tax=Chenopodium quinoa TaxID=63459 RepID=A0A803MZZ5_CHEQI